MANIAHAQHRAIKMIFYLNQKLGEEKGLVQFANRNILHTATSHFV